MSKWRKKVLNNDTKKFFETMFYVVLTGTLMYFSPLIVNNCVEAKDPTPGKAQDDFNQLKDKFNRYLCPDGYYSPLATILFNPLGSVFKVLMNEDYVFSYPDLAIYLAIWYPMTIFCYGTNIPAGLFVSGILIGCSYGRLIG
jgi:hypothetical protein